MSVQQIRYRTVRANGIDFEVAQCGDGDKLALFLHGFPELAFCWRSQMPVLAAAGYQAWAPNLRGYGKTTRPQSADQYQLHHHVADVAALIDVAGKSETMLIGHDWGGAIAWLFALNKVRPLQGLIIMNVPHPIRLLQSLRRPTQLLKSLYIVLFQIPRLPEWLLGGRRALLIGAMIRNTAVNKATFADEVIDVYRNHAAQPGALTAMLNYYRANFNLFDRATRKRHLGEKRAPLATPTLMLWGEKDAAFSIRATYRTDQLVSDLTLRYLPHSSHWVQQDTPQTVNRLLDAWINGRPVPYVDAGGHLFPLSSTQ